MAVRNIQQENIPLNKGIHRSPSIPTSGELSECLGLIPRSGELVNIAPPVSVPGIELPKGAVLKAVHNYNGVETFFYWHDKALYSVSAGQQPKKMAGEYSDPHTSVFCTGNTITVSDRGKNFYYLLKHNEFQLLGDRIPVLNLAFALRGSLETYPEHPSRESEAPYMVGVLDKEYNKSREDLMLGRANAFIEHFQKKGKFVHPFLIRYALRLYDGSLVNVSSPAMLVPLTCAAPLVITNRFRKDDGHNRTEISARAVSPVCSVVFETLSGLEELKQWGDIIKSVDFFVSSLPVYNQGGHMALFPKENAPFILSSSGSNPPFTPTSELSYLPTVHAFSYVEGTFGKSEKVDSYKKRDIADTSISFLKDHSGSLSDLINTSIESLPSFTKAEYKALVESASDFRLVSSIDVERYGDELGLGDLSQWFNGSKPTISRAAYPLTIEEDVLNNLATREQLDASCDSDRSEQNRTNVFEYNSRINSYGDTRVLYHGAPATSFCQFMTENAGGVFTAYTTIEKNGMLFTLKEIDDGASRPLNPDGAPFYVHHPDDGAKEMTIVYTPTSGPAKSRTFKLKACPAMPGACHFEAFEGYETYTEGKPLPFTTGDSFSVGNVIKISSTLNPFTQKDEDSVTVGSGKILAVTTTAQALSQGQFGQHPLYVFCTDGIWALAVADDGTYSARQPISRDVLSNVNGVLQLDKAVAYVTRRGLMLLTGSHTEPLTPQMDGQNFDERFLTTSDLTLRSAVTRDTASFVEMLQTARLAYDAPHHLIHIFPDPSFFEAATPDDAAALSHHYVVDIASHEVSKQALGFDLTTSVPSYPLTTLQLGGGLYHYDHIDTPEVLRPGYALTRPVALSSPVEYKTLYDRQLLLRRTTADSRARVYTYFSNDNLTWYPYTHFKMRSAKYYRFLIVTNLTDNDALQGLTLLYQPRYGYRLQ